MTILEKLEELKNDCGSNYGKDAVLRAIQIVKGILPTEEQIRDCIDKKNLYGCTIDVFKEFGLLQPPPKRYKWTDGFSTTDILYSEDEFSKLPLQSHRGWHKVKEEV